MTKRISAAALLLLALISNAAPAAPPDIRLYTLDCGRIDIEDMKTFSDTGEHDGERGVMPVTCFLIRHGETLMLWDAGLGDEIALQPQGMTLVGLHFRVPVTLLPAAALETRRHVVRIVYCVSLSMQDLFGFSITRTAKSLGPDACCLSADLRYARAASNALTPPQPRRSTTD